MANCVCVASTLYKYDLRKGDKKISDVGQSATIVSGDCYFQCCL